MKVFRIGYVITRKDLVQAEHGINIPEELKQQAISKLLEDVKEKGAVIVKEVNDPRIPSEYTDVKQYEASLNVLEEKDIQALRSVLNNVNDPLVFTQMIRRLLANL